MENPPGHDPVIWPDSDDADIDLELMYAKRTLLSRVCLLIYISNFSA